MASVALFQSKAIELVQPFLKNRFLLLLFFNAMSPHIYKVNMIKCLINKENFRSNYSYSSQTISIVMLVIWLRKLITLIIFKTCAISVLYDDEKTYRTKTNVLLTGERRMRENKRSY